MPGEVIGHVREPNIVLEVWCFFFLIFLFLVVYVVIVVAAVEQMYQSSYKKYVYTHRLELRSPLEILLPAVGSRMYSAERYSKFDYRIFWLYIIPICLSFFYIFAYSFDVLSRIIAKASIRKLSSDVSFWGLHTFIHCVENTMFKSLCLLRCFLIWYKINVYFHFFTCGH